jgi:hypothetical protein
MISILNMFMFQRVAVDESVFYMTHGLSLFVSFSSVKYYLIGQNDMFLAVKRNGPLKSGIHTLPGQHDVQFLAIPVQSRFQTVRDWAKTGR